MKATLTARDEAGGRLLVVDCEHGQTFGHYTNAPDGRIQLTDADVARWLLARHYAAEHCRCTRQLRRRYGVAA